MLSRAILTRGAFVALALIGLFALADGAVRIQLASALSISQDAEPRPAVVHVASVAD